MISVTGMAALGFVTLTGDFDVVDSEELQAAARELIGVGVADLTVDLSHVTFLAAAGLDALVAVDQQFERVGGRMILVGANRATRRVFEIARLDRAYHIVPARLGRRAPLRTRRASGRETRAARPRVNRR
jgi:anti-sigma B factor antagonist